MEKEPRFMVKGESVEGCTSPPACPGMWGSPLQAQFHNGVSECEGVRHFHITQGYYGDIDLSGLTVSYAFNLPSPFPPPEPQPWKGILYIDAQADERQAEALEKIFGASAALKGDTLAVKRAKIEFKKETLGAGPAASYTIKMDDFYTLVTRPLLTENGKPRYLNNPFDLLIYVGAAEVDRFADPDLPRGEWDAPGTTVWYNEFSITPDKLNWGAP